MTPFRAGALVATVVAGPPLWLQVRSGSIDATTAVERGALVALACAAGSSGVRRIVHEYQVQVLRKPTTGAVSRAPGVSPGSARAPGRSTR